MSVGLSVSGQGLEVVKGVMMDIIYVETKGIRVDGEALRLLQHGEFGWVRGGMSGRRVLRSCKQ